MSHAHPTTRDEAIEHIRGIVAQPRTGARLELVASLDLSALPAEQAREVWHYLTDVLHEDELYELLGRAAHPSEFLCPFPYDLAETLAPEWPPRVAGLALDGLDHDTLEALTARWILDTGHALLDHVESERGGVAAHSLAKARRALDEVPSDPVRALEEATAASWEVHALLSDASHAYRVACEEQGIDERRDVPPDCDLAAYCDVDAAISPIRDALLDLASFYDDGGWEDLHAAQDKIHGGVDTLSYAACQQHVRRLGRLVWQALQAR